MDIAYDDLLTHALGYTAPTSHDHRSSFRRSIEVARHDLSKTWTRAFRKKVMATSDPKSQANLLRIPQETRDNIYSFIGDVNDFRSLWVCRQLYNETREVFYNNFALEVDVFADCRRSLNGFWNVDGIPRQNLVRHGPYGGRRALRPLNRKIPQGASLKSVHILISTLWRPSDLEATWCSFCQNDRCGKCGTLLYNRLVNCVRSKVDHQVSVKLYYHLDGELETMSRPETRVLKKTQMLSIFDKKNYLPQCDTLIICCSAETRTSSEVGVRQESNDLEWTSIYNKLFELILRGSSLEHLEIWLPECIFRPVQTEAPKSRRRLNHGGKCSDFLRAYQESLGRPEVLPHPKDPSLRSLKLMVWNDQERPFQQRVPVRALEAEELKEYLESQVVH
ncbi:MAG: hypothetical protein Q9226_005808 [Calogaya cf. arnoldii]